MKKSISKKDMLGKVRKKRTFRTLILALSAMVVFVTTYMLILPAITLDEQEALSQGGIDLAMEDSQTAENVNAEVTDDTKEETADIVSDSKETSQETGTVTAEVKDTKKQEPQGNTPAEPEQKNKQDAKTEKQPEPEMITTKTDLTAEGEGFNVTATVNKKSEVPATTELAVEEMTDEHDDYDQLVKEAKKAINEEFDKVKSFKVIGLYDISLQSEGETVEPNNKVNVSISYDKGAKVSDAENIRIVHFGEEKTEVLEAETTLEKSKLSETSFDTDSFSPFAVVEVETIEKTVITADGKTYKISVKYDKNAGIPEGSTLDVKELTGDDYAEYLDKTADTLDKAADDLGYAKFFDITIMNGKDEVKIQNPVDVEIQLLDNEDLNEDTQVVHFGEKPEVVDSKVEGDTVKFEADGFSVYAVVDSGDTGENARMTIEFYDHDGTTLLETAYVKNSDTLAEIVEIVSDPNPTIPSGKLFKGWIQDKQNYTVEDVDKAKTLGQIREWAEAKEITENETVKFYPVIYTSFKVTYKDGDHIIVGTENELRPYSTTSIPYTVNMAYTAPDDTHNFEGWLAVDGMSNITSASYVNEDGDTVTIDTSDPNSIYPNGASLTITGNVTFGVSAPEGHWLVFHENGKNATYNAPQFIKSGQTTSAPATPERYGYTFGGWYTDADCTAGNEFTFGSTINETTHVYAKWTAKATAPYTILIWKQNVEGNGYDFEETVTGTGNVGSNIPLGNATNRNYTGFHLKETPEPVKIVPEGNAVVNVYYDRTEYTLTFRAQGGYIEATNNSGTQYGLVDGEYVQLTRSGYSGNYTWSYSAYEYSVTTDNDNNPQKYDANGTPIWRQNGQWWYYSGNILTGQYNGQPYTRTERAVNYTGTRYVYSNDMMTVKEIKALYQQNISDNFPIVGDNGRTYDQGERWKPGSNNQGWSEVMVFIETMPAESITFTLDEANRPLKTMYYYVEALPTDTQNVVTRGGTRYVLYNTISARYNGVTAEDYSDLDGFTKKEAAPSVNGDAYVLGQNTYNSTFYIYNETQNQSIYFFYSREAYKINYMDGVYVDGNGNAIDETKEATWGTSGLIPYQSNISSYNKGGDNYYAPTKTNYVFDGWYIDDACTTPYTFNKMPKGGVTVYAKWRQVQYRVFLHPNVPESDQTLNWGDEELDEEHKQQMNFRISLGETVSVPTGLRQDYEMVGWYLDEACTQLFNAENYVLNETTVTTPYNKETHMTDPMNKYGNITDESAAYNSDARNNRNWINKELNLYAKWRKVIDGAEGISVVYDAGKGSGTAPTDTNLYLDSASSTALTSGQIVPPTPPEGSDISEYVFDYWVLQTWDKQKGEYVDTSTYVYPGDTFIVLLDNAKKEAKMGDDGQQAVVDGVPQYNYTVKLRAEYVPKDISTPTHIDWFANNGTAASVSDSKEGKLKINEPIPIRPANTFSYPGHKFLGWARVEDSGTGTHPDLDLDEDDLWLIYDEATNTFKVKQEGTAELRTVSQIAADERNPYHDLYAVWETNTYTVSIEKVVEGTDEDQKTAFTINYDYDDTSLTDGSVERKHGQEAIVISEEVPYGTVVAVSETGYTAFEQSYSASRTTDDQGNAISPAVKVTPETEGSGNFKITGDTVITVTNTRKTQDVTFGKTLEGSQTGDTSAVTSAVFTLSDGTNTYTASPANDGTVKFTGVLFGEYALKETTAPTGYAKIADHTVTVDENGFTIKLNGKDIGKDGVYTIDDPLAENGSFTLVKTNEDGTK